MYIILPQYFCYYQGILLRHVGLPPTAIFVIIKEFPVRRNVFFFMKQYFRNHIAKQIYYVNFNFIQIKMLDYVLNNITIRFSV